MQRDSPLKCVRFVSATFKSFLTNECHAKAALLTFYSLISIVPFLAFTLGIAKAFGFDTFLKNQILTTFKEQEDLLSTAIQFAHSLIMHIQSGTIAGLGLLFLFVTLFGLLENIEKSLNAIWKIDKPRNLLHKISDYLTILIICPILFVVSSGITLFISTHITDILPQYPILQEISPIIIFFINLVPYFLNWMLFAFIYLFVPNMRPRFFPRILAAFISGTFFQLWQVAYFEFQGTITSYNTVYGSFAALPLFLIWTQVNYIIFLYGAEIAAQIENNRGKFSSDRYTPIHPKALALLLLQEITAAFLKGESPLSTLSLSQKFGLPLYKTREILQILEKGEVLSEIKTKRYKEEIYQLLIDPDLLTINKISELIDHKMEEPTLVKKSDLVSAILGSFSVYHDLQASSTSNLTLRQLVHLK